MFVDDIVPVEVEVGAAVPHGCVMISHEEAEPVSNQSNVKELVVMLEAFTCCGLGHETKVVKVDATDHRLVSVSEHIAFM